MAMLFRLLYNKWFSPPLPPSDTFKDQTILISGATGGLGLEAAIQFVSLGASTVIITARTLSRGLAAQATIEARTGKTGIVQVRELDMSTLAGVKTFVDSLKEDVKAIDVVLLNAGVYKMTYDLSPDGWEETLQVNTLSTILFALLLLPWMKTSPPEGGRTQHLGFVSSGLHTKAKIETEDFPQEDVLRYWSDEKHFLASESYALSKLFMMYGVAEIVKLAHGEDEKLVKSSNLSRIVTIIPIRLSSDLVYLVPPRSSTQCVPASANQT
jgi:NAD(P)-dependent dehydrogenase (short-subunit alcohol dehydrogenase family)